MRFSGRLPSELVVNVISGLLESKKESGARIYDLTESNPTRAGIEYPAGFLASLADERAMFYEPESFGLPSARKTIAARYDVPFSRVALTASTSEAYAWIFKLLCDPGDEVLVPRPSYPLFEYLAALECVRVRHYSLFHDHGWYIDFHTLQHAISDRTKAIVLVNPNNPTGHFIHRHESVELIELCASRGIAIVSDEVFTDYRLDVADDSVTTMHGNNGALTFCLNGLSKTVGLPQMKLAWLLASGPQPVLRDALARLEMIADTYLSAGTPVQLALPKLLEVQETVQQQILSRLRLNLRRLRRSGLRVLPVEAGWYAIIPLPGWRTEEEWVHWLLAEHNVLVQPGYFYDFEQSGFAVLSLLTRPDVFEHALQFLPSLG